VASELGRGVPEDSGVASVAAASERRALRDEVDSPRDDETATGIACSTSNILGMVSCPTMMPSSSFLLRLENQEIRQPMRMSTTVVTTTPIMMLVRLCDLERRASAAAWAAAWAAIWVELPLKETSPVQLTFVEPFVETKAVPLAYRPLLQTKVNKYAPRNRE
jgi:hypothetical protein